MQIKFKLLKLLLQKTIKFVDLLFHLILSYEKHLQTIQRRKDLMKKAEVEEMENEIRNFEKKIKTQISAPSKTESLW